MIKEFCAENYTAIKKAINKGIHRIELCDYLAAGGTTPSIGVIKQTLQAAKETKIDVAVMIRPRTGDFCYNEEEQQIMKTDIKVVEDLGAEAIVLGCLTEANQLDVAAMTYLLSDVRCHVVFHMAFDLIPADDKQTAIDQLVALGVTRVLLHGKHTDVITNIDEINQYIAYAAGRLSFVVGGGVTFDNLEYLASHVNTDEFHGTKIVELDK